MRTFLSRIRASAGLQLPSLPSASGLGTDASGNVIAVTPPSGGPFVGQVVHAAFAPGAPWLLCDGSAVTVASGKTVLRNGLIAAGNPFGVSGSDPLLPNLKGRVPVGRDASQVEFDTAGKTGGAKTQTLTAGQLPAHDHDFLGGRNAGGDSATLRASLVTNVADFGLPNMVYGLRDGSGNVVTPGQAHNNLQPFVVIDSYIYAG